MPKSLTPAISVIVPIYNVARWLPECLASLDGQTMRDHEILLVNDGSTDGSGEIACAFAAERAHVTLLNRRNGGAAAARNEGVRAARGEYLCFVDSDDTLSPRYLQKMLEAARRTRADVVVCNYSVRVHARVNLRSYKVLRTRTLVAERAMRIALRDNLMRNYLWNKLFARRLFTEHEIEMPGIRFEDLATVPRLIYHSDRVVWIPDMLYTYRKHAGSLMSGYSRERIENSATAIGILRDFLLEQRAYEHYEADYRALVRKFRNSCQRDMLICHLRSREGKLREQERWVRARFDSLLPRGADKSV